MLLVVFCVNAGYGGSRLGACWAILEERYEDYRAPVRNPYATIAYRAVGPWARYCRTTWRNSADFLLLMVPFTHFSKLVSGCIQFTLFGAGTVYLLLAAQIVKDLMDSIFPSMGLCAWFLVIGLLLIPAMWLGSPKDFL